jgi:GNAT superfamily N-acetyltransferase
MSSTSISVRPMVSLDVPAVKGLLFQLGYFLEFEEVRRRYRIVAVSVDHVVLVAEQLGLIVGFCHIYGRPALDKPPEAVVQVLVVDETSRGGGVGKAMMRAAEGWAVDRGFTSIALASDIVRAQAHEFYDSIGYRHFATSHLFRKVLI